jgi:hypothetical protein
MFNGAAGQATLKSVIVNRGPESDSMRSAQLPQQPGAGEAGANSSGAGAAAQPEGSPLLRSLQQQFGAPPEGQGGFRTPDTGRQPGGQPMPLPPDLTRPDTQDLIAPGTGMTLPQPDQIPLTPTPMNESDAVQAEERRSTAACAQELANVRANTLDKVSLDIRVKGTAGKDFPFECTIEEGMLHGGRLWPGTTYTWKASALCHKPLYFEDEQMERYGHSWGPCCDPIVSGVHFFCKLPVLPYCMGVTPPCECVYALGHYRPGNCAPYYLDPVPISCRGALFQAGAVTGVAAVLP